MLQTEQHRLCDHKDPQDRDPNKVRQIKSGLHIHTNKVQNMKCAGDEHELLRGSILDCTNVATQEKRDFL